jgi:putative phosphoesterase
MTRVLLLSDTHGFVDPRIAAMAARVDYVVHAGDIGGEDILRQLAADARLVAVRGNNDLPANWNGDGAGPAALPEEAVLELPGGRLVVVHGHRAGAAAGRHRRLRRDYPDARAVVYGHSHRLVIDTEDPIWILNPGAAGRTRTFGGPSCIVLTAASELWQAEEIRLEPLPRK